MTEADRQKASFDAWHFTAPGTKLPSFPLMTEALYAICDNNPTKFELLNEHLRLAFNAGWDAK